MNIIQNKRQVNMICYMLIITMFFSLFSGFGVYRVYGYTKKTGTVTGGTLNIRKGPGTSYDIIGTYNDGATVSIIGEGEASDGSLWYKVSFTKSGAAKEGYVHSKYVTNIKDVIEYEEDADFEAYLDAQGFPESYKEGLRNLHAKYPKWVFEADHLDYVWADALKEQNKLGRSLISVNSISSWKSTQTGAYDWEKSAWVGFDTDSWVCASKELIAYYMDPRNFLDENSVFQFQLLSYNPAVHTTSGLKTLVKGSFLEKGTIKNSAGTANISYVKAIMEAAEQSGVSPYLLASSIIFEMGNDGSSGSISGKYTGYEGYYNYYNWGASAHSGRNPIQNGLLYAMNEDEATMRPWNTKYKALVGGAMKFGADYVNVGQDTAYYKKFDYVGTPYTHQYMTHIMGAYLEGTESAAGYSDAIRESTALVFKIPVFKEMPDEVAVCPTKDGSPNNRLKKLAVSGHTLTPTFKMSTTKYNLVVENDVETIKVSATAVDSSAKIKGHGTKELKVGQNTIKVTVTAENGSSRVYQINVIRNGTNEEETEGGTDEPTTDEPTTDEPTTEEPTTEKLKPEVSTKYTLDKKNKILTGIAVNTSVKTALSKIKVTNGKCYFIDKNGKKKTKGNLASADNLVILDNDGKIEKKYTVIIYGDVNGDGKINIVDAVRIKRYLLGEIKLGKIGLMAGDANRKKDGVNIVDALRIRRFILGEVSINQK